MNGPVAALSKDGKRLHLQHGPIDLIVEAEGEANAVEGAYERAWVRFRTVLEDLVAELPTLRRPLGGTPHEFNGSVAQRMRDAVSGFHGGFVTPMAAVAGAVADEICEAIGAFEDAAEISRAFVNNGGDIALLLAPGTSYDVGLVPVPNRPAIIGKTTILAEDQVRGIATSGRHGRSHSLGVADAVTVLARQAATADVAATLIANAVDLPGHPAVERVTAMHLDPDTDLGKQLVTTAVGALTDDDVVTALTAGSLKANAMVETGSIIAAVLCLNDEIVSVGSPAGSARRLTADNESGWSGQI
ncbi:MAG: UPF0280 family protein [Actinomycetota bacterium]|nr:UPF0280 family protein [Actinomycetota bacterium]